jgi:hypothetical protein
MPKRVEEHLTTVTNLPDLRDSLHGLHQAELETLVDTKYGHPTPIQGVRNTGLDRIVGGVGGRYEIVNHEDLLLSIVDRLDANGMEISKASVYQSPTGMFTDITFRGSKTIVPYSPEAQQALKNGDIIEAGIRVQNGYTGQTPARAGLFGKRLWCANGLMTKMEALSVTKKHTKSGLLGLHEALIKFVDQASEKLDHWFVHLDRSQTIEVSKDLHDVFRQAGFGVRQAGQIQTHYENRYQNELGLNAYSAYNAATHFITHDCTGSQQSIQGLHEKANVLLTAGAYVLPEAE